MFYQLILSIIPPKKQISMLKDCFLCFKMKIKIFKIHHYNDQVSH
jgi:hypothetical protein